MAGLLLLVDRLAGAAHVSASRVWSLVGLGYGVRQFPVQFRSVSCRSASQARNGRGQLLGHLASFACEAYKASIIIYYYTILVGFASLQGI